MIFPWHRQRFSELAANRDQLPHALLLTGPAGSGLEVFALEFSKFLLCEHPHDDGSCGECPSCKWFAALTHPDFRLVSTPAYLEAKGLIPQGEDAPATDDEKADKKAASVKVGIEQVRKATEVTKVSSFAGGRRVILVMPAEAMTGEAANALLKTLEEPPAGTVLILVCPHASLLLPTVVSRCRQIPFPAPDWDASVEWLKEKGVPDAELSLSRAGGAPETALSDYENGLYETLAPFYEALKRPDALTVINASEKLAQRPAIETISAMQRYLCDLLRAVNGLPPYFHPDMSELLTRQAPRVNVPALLKLITDVTEKKRTASHPLVARLVIEDMLLSYRHVFVPKTAAG